MEMQFYLIAPLLIFLISKNVYVLFACVVLSLFAQKLGGPTTVLTFLTSSASASPPPCMI
jgi:peptidoglycan/LPS O-acetylase OafA/YrhL